jgi:hypothetical protein
MTYLEIVIHGHPAGSTRHNDTTGCLGVLRMTPTPAAAVGSSRRHGGFHTVGRPTMLLLLLELVVLLLL